MQELKKTGETKMKKSKLVLMLILSALLSINGFAQADRLKDLIDTRASSGESDLETRGYVLTHTSNVGCNERITTKPPL